MVLIAKQAPYNLLSSLCTPLAGAQIGAINIYNQLPGSADQEGKRRREEKENQENSILCMEQPIAKRVKFIFKD